MRGQNSRNSSEIYRARLLLKASRGAASNDAFIARSLESLKLAADSRPTPYYPIQSPHYYYPIQSPHFYPIQSPHDYDPIQSEPQVELLRVTYRRRVLERHGVQPDAPIHDQLSADLASYSWLREKFPRCPARILQWSLKFARRFLPGRSRLRGGHVNHGDMRREQDLAAEYILKFLARKKIILILMAHSRGVPAAGSPFSDLPLKVILMILEQC
jgi:hypothetical protein